MYFFVCVTKEDCSFDRSDIQYKYFTSSFFLQAKSGRDYWGDMLSSSKLQADPFAYSDINLSGFT